MDIKKFQKLSNSYNLERSIDKQLINAKNTINKSFSNSPSCEKVLINEELREVVFRAMDEKDYIILKPYEKVDVSNLIYYKNRVFLICTFEDINKITPKAQIAECDYTLKYINKYGKLIEVPCISSNKTLYTLGIKESQDSPIAVGDNKLSIVLPKNKFTKCIRRDFRLVCDERVWKVASFDGTKGYLSLMCSEEQIKVGQDDMVNDIPYNNYEPITITCLQTNYNLKINDITEVKVEVRQGIELLNELVNIASGDETKVKVLENNKIQVLDTGKIELNISLVNNPNIYIKIPCIVEDVLEESTVFDITSSTGRFNLKKGSIVTYTPKKIINNSEINALWNFEIDYGSVSVNNIEIKEITDTYIKIRSLADKGTITLKAIERNIENIIEKKITLKPIY